MSYMPKENKWVAKTEEWMVTTEPASSVFSRLRRRTRFSAVAEGVRAKPNQRAEDKNNYSDFYVDGTIMEVIARIGGLGRWGEDPFYGETRHEAVDKLKKHICAVVKAHKAWEEQERATKQTLFVDAEDVCS